MNNNYKRLKQIEIENKIWIVYFFLIGLCLYGNSFEKKYFLYGNNYDKEKYRKITIFIFSIAVIIYFYFFIDSYKDVKNNNYNTKSKSYSELSFLGSTLILISGLIFLYLAVVDIDLDIELAFN